MGPFYLARGFPWGERFLHSLSVHQEDEEGGLAARPAPAAEQ
jgi:hypothetical protein